MSALMVLGELRAVGAFVPQVVNPHRALPSIAGYFTHWPLLRTEELALGPVYHCPAAQKNGNPALGLSLP